MELAPTRPRSRPLEPWLVGALSIALHGLLALAISSVRLRPLPARQEAITVAVVERVAPPAPPPAAPLAPAQRPLARQRALPAPPALKARAPPPPSEEAPAVAKAPPLIVTGITLNSTASGGSFAVGVGNTLGGKPPKVAVAPDKVKPYQAEHYALAEELNEPPSVAVRADLRKFYPPEAQRNSFEGDVELRLLIDADGSLAKVELVRDPGEGLGAAGVRAIREFRFRPGKVAGAAVATTITFVLHFLLS